jgi:lysophospholipase L1-like esterase
VAQAAVIDSAARAVLAPVLHAQIGLLRRSVVELPVPEGPTQGQAGTGTVRLRLLVAGDSSAAGVGAASQDEALAAHLSRRLAALLGGRVVWQLVAQVGARSEDVLHLLMRTDLHPADVAVVVVGINDIAKEVPLAHALRNRSAVAALISKRTGARHVVFPALPEMEKFPALPQPLAWYAGRHARRNNAEQAAWAAPQRGVTHVVLDGVMDPALMADDGFHPGPALYAKVAERLALHIKNEVLPRLDNNQGAP